MAEIMQGLDFYPRSWGQDGASLPCPSASERGGKPWPWYAGSGVLFASAVLASWWTREPARRVAPHDLVAAAAPAATATQFVERTVTLFASDELSALLQAQGLTEADTHAIVSQTLPAIAGDGEVRVELTLRLSGTAAEAIRVKATRPDSSGVVLIRNTATPGWRTEPIARAVETRITVGRGEMNADSLYSSALAAGIDDSLIPDFAQAFVYDFDFQRDIRPGDVFEMAAEQSVNAEGERIGAPRLVYAAFTTTSKARALYRFTPAGGAAGWFDGNGRSIVRSLMRTPVDGARVSSTFGWRVHPIEGYRKLHRGIDFAIPSGTPIYAAGKGIVETAHFSASAGNMVILRHAKGYETKYFHLSSFAAGIVDGAVIAQGQQIALSGTTGHSTGPHLHYELHLNGEPIDPAGVQADEGQVLSGADLVAFRRERDRIDGARAHHAN